MTCIVAIETSDSTYIAADRFGSNGYVGEPYENPKIVNRGRVVFGFSGSYRMAQILQYGLEIPEKTLDNDVDRWVAIDFVQAMRKAFKENDWNKEDSGVAKSENILAVVDGRCYEIQSDFSFLRTLTGEYAVGSGQDYAKGSLRSTRKTKKATARLVEALDAASEYVISVGGPYDLLTVKKKKG